MSRSDEFSVGTTESLLVDSHCHLHDREFFTVKQSREMLKRAREKGVKKIICIGTSFEDSKMAQKFANKFDGVFWTFGVHPEAAKNLPEVNDILKECEWGLENALDGKPPVGIGEVGLDYHYPGYDRAAQINLFEGMLALAEKHNLPVAFHIREAFDDFFPVVANFPKLRGVVHSFSDNKKNLRRVLEETSFYVGVNGMATYSTLPMPPLERILLETDAPFLTPKPFRGIINEPGYVREVALWLSAQLGQDFAIIAKETTENARQLFNV